MPIVNNLLLCTPEFLRLYLRLMPMLKLTKQEKRKKQKQRNTRKLGDDGYVYLDCGGGIIDACVCPNSSSYTH